ncbi:MAG: DNA recombination protein RmuC [Flavisolibacter sp.]
MEITTLLLLAAAVVFGTALTFILLRITGGKNQISRGELDAVSQEATALRSEKTFLQQQLTELRSEKSSIQAELQQQAIEVNRLHGLAGSGAKEAEQLQIRTRQLEAELADTQKEHSRLSGELSEARQQLSTAQTELKHAGQKLEGQQQEMEKLGEKFEAAFKVLAQQILDDKSKKFTETQEQNLKTLLEPLQTQINQFKQDIEVKHKQESDERISLREQVKIITETNKTLSEQANKLTETLRLQVKQQGDWGESILESILENSGLQKDLQYFTQQSAQNDDGKRIRPDVLVKYPDQRTLIIDSKVSLVHYYEMCSAVGEEEQKQYAKQLVQSLYSHIDGLAAKSYADLTQALDFVIMFVPVETAYIAAMHADPDLWQYAYKKQILLISPANLIATLKLVKDMWRKDAIDKNAQEIAERAGKLYDKLAGFVDTFETVGAQIGKAGETWETARRQLTTGRGNLIGQAERMKQLGIDAKKSIPEKMVGDAEDDGELKLYE